MHKSQQLNLTSEVTRLALEEEKNVPTKIERDFKFVRNWGKMPVIRRKHLLKDQLAYGAISVYFGESGARKTHWETYVASKVSTGGTWFNGEECEQGHVIYINLEDQEEELIERLTANGANFDYIHPVRMIPVNKPKSSQQTGERAISFPDDLELLDELIQHYGAHLVIVDSVKQVFSNHLSEAVCKKIMGPLSMIAQNNHCAIMLINHTGNKTIRESPESASNTNLLNNTSGAKAINNMARAVLYVYKTTDNPMLSAIRCAKSNIGREDFDPIFYTLQEGYDGLLRVVFVDRMAIERDETEQLATRDADTLSKKQVLQGRIIGALFDEQLTQSQLIQRFRTLTYPIWVELVINEYLKDGVLCKDSRGKLDLAQYVRDDLVQQGYHGKTLQINGPKTP